MSTDYTQLGAERYVALLPSAARTATPNKQQVTFTDDVDYVVLVVNVTSAAASGTVTALIEGVDPVTQATYPILTATDTAQIGTSTGTFAYQVGPSLTPGPDTAIGQTHNQSSNYVVPNTIRITLTHSGSATITYSATLLAPV